MTMSNWEFPQLLSQSPSLKTIPYPHGAACGKLEQNEESVSHVQGPASQNGGALITTAI